MTPLERRFGGVARLVGSAGLDRLQRSHLCVVGLGGVGSWAVEALARSAVGALTLVDMDDVCISNVNRQLHAVTGQFGRPKVESMAQRVAAINPDCKIHVRQSFFLPSNADEILQGRFDAVLDCIDSPSLKALLIAKCHHLHIPVVTIGGAGGRMDPSQIEICDLAFSSHDRLLQQVRRLLRRRHGFPRGDCAFGVECVLSREQPRFPTGTGQMCTARSEAADLRLDCNSGFGTAAFVTGAFGLLAASRIVRNLTENSIREAGETVAVDKLQL